MIDHNGCIVVNSSAAQQSSLSEAVFKCNSNISLKGEVYTMEHWNIFDTHIFVEKASESMSNHWHEIPESRAQS